MRGRSSATLPRLLGDVPKQHADGARQPPERVLPFLPPSGSWFGGMLAEPLWCVEARYEPSLSMPPSVCLCKSVRACSKTVNEYAHCASRALSIVFYVEVARCSGPADSKCPGSRAPDRGTFWQETPKDAYKAASAHFISFREICHAARCRPLYRRDSASDFLLSPVLSRSGYG